MSIVDRLELASSNYLLIFREQKTSFNGFRTQIFRVSLEKKKSCDADINEYDTQ